MDNSRKLILNCCCGGSIEIVCAQKNVIDEYKEEFLKKHENCIALIHGLETKQGIDINKKPC